jgi:hypothetical protein
VKLLKFLWAWLALGHAFFMLRRTKQVPSDHERTNSRLG